MKKCRNFEKFEDIKKKKLRNFWDKYRKLCINYYKYLIKFWVNFLKFWVLGKFKQIVFPVLLFFYIIFRSILYVIQIIRLLEINTQIQTDQRKPIILLFWLKNTFFLIAVMKYYAGCITLSMSYFFLLLFMRQCTTQSSVHFEALSKSKALSFFLITEQEPKQNTQRWLTPITVVRNFSFLKLSIYLGFQFRNG